MLMLSQADREQCAAFIRDERVMVIWSESIDRIVPLCADFEERLIKLLWRSRPMAPSSVASGNPGSISAHGSIAGHATSDNGVSSFNEGFNLLPNPPGSATLRSKGVFGELGRDPTDEPPLDEKAPSQPRTQVKRTWYGGKKVVQADSYEMDTSNTNSFEDEESDPSSLAEKVSGDAWDVENNAARKRPVKMYSPIYNGIAAGLALVFVGNGVRTLIMEWKLDGDFIRFALLAVSPLLYCVSLFFALQIVQNVSMACVFFSISFFTFAYSICFLASVL